ncbi:MAG TPA: DISARM system phospholipase D-like protein DrmC [Thermoanaerobaculia bacterium]|nr:DISARM system phospholipase D-like protein DrmC [Thermoanaerobaculia bacterium]
MSTGDLALTKVPVQALEDLRRELVRFPSAQVTEAWLARVTGEPYAASLRFLCDLPREGVCAVLDAVIAERNAQRGPELELVWTGPEATVSHTRSNAVVLRQLFERAKDSVLIGGYAFDHGKEIFEPLHRAMRDKGVRAEIFMDLRGEAKSGVSSETFATECVDRFLQENWLFDGPRPEIYYAPLTAAWGASLHAKCVVVDGLDSLITSANFTDRGQTRNLELGVLIRDRGFAEILVAQWRGLVSQGIVVRYEG